MPRRALVLSALLASVAWVGVAPTTAEAAMVVSVSSDTLTVIGDAADDRLVLRLAPGAPGTLLLDTGSSTASFDRGSFSRISIRTGGGADEIRIDEVNGSFTEAETTTIESSTGADIVVGGRGAEVIATGDDDDLVFAGGGGDTLLLGAGDDTAIQGTTDGSDLVEGQSGSDTLRTFGSGESEEFTVQAVGTRIRITCDVGSGRVDMAGIETAEIIAGAGPDLVDIGDLSGTGLTRVDADLGLLDGASDTVFATGTPAKDTIVTAAAGDTARITGLPSEVRIENASATDDRLIVQARGGDDNVRAVEGVGTLVGLTLEGNEGRDVITGGTAAEVLRGGSQNDILRGNQGVDTVEGGDGDDLVIWSSVSDGDETVGSDAGRDTLRVPSTTADDVYDIASVGSRVRISGGAFQLDLEKAEAISVGTGVGADKVTVRDLTGTGTETVSLDVGRKDLKVDTIVVEGTPGSDQIEAGGSAGVHDVTGLAAGVGILDAEPGDRLEIVGSAGDDTIDARKMAKDQLQPLLRGGPDKDVLLGSPGQDVVDGGTGNDVAFLGAGLDTFNWQPGDASDIVEGGAGTDFLRMSGSVANEHFRVSPIGSRTRLIRDLENVLMDLGQVERLDINPAAGSDTMQVDDMSGTDTKLVTWELAPSRGTTATDQAADKLLVNGTFGNDSILVTAGGHQVRVAGLASTVEINRSDPTLDSLHVDTRPGGTDSVTVGPGVQQLLKFTHS